MKLVVDISGVHDEVVTDFGRCLDRIGWQVAEGDGPAGDGLLTMWAGNLGLEDQRKTRAAVEAAGCHLVELTNEDQTQDDTDKTTPPEA